MQKNNLTKTKTHLNELSFKEVDKFHSNIDEINIKHKASLAMKQKLLDEQVKIANKIKQVRFVNESLSRIAMKTEEFK